MTGDNVTSAASNFPDRDYGEFVAGTAMQCPECETHLEVMDERRYETLAEHVSAPNAKPSLFGLRWLEDGEGPYLSGCSSRPGERRIPKGTLYYEIYMERHNGK